MNQRIVFKFTTKSRPTNFFRGLDSIVNNLANKEDYYIQATCDTDDPAMNNPEVIARMRTYKNLIYYFGESSSKIDAVNQNLDKLSEDWHILFCMSDDMVMTKFGFDDIIRRDMPEDLDCFLHYVDSNFGDDRLCTLSIVGRKYFLRDNYIYNPEYKNVYCDQEETEKAKMLGKHKFSSEHIFEHLHPVFKKSDWDAQYRENEDQSKYIQDRETYLRRKAINFGV